MLNQALENYKLILGSGSPRRRELLKYLDIDFEVQTTNTDENFPIEMAPEQVPLFLAQKKARAFDNIIQDNWIVITADTVVILNDEILGKPHNADNAKIMLAELSGQRHQVITGVCIRSQKNFRCLSDETKVWFKNLTQQEIDYYVEKYKPFDKAGAYGIQEWIGYIGIEKIEGSYQNVVGLPVQKLYVELFNFLKLQSEQLKN